MAKFVGGLPPFVGTKDNLTIYFMKGEYIVRTKSSLTGKRVKRDPTFARTMESAGRLKKASRIASLIYGQIPADSRVYKQYRELVGKAMGLLKNGFGVEYVLTALEVAYLNHHFPDCLPVHLHQENGEKVALPISNNCHPVIFSLDQVIYACYVSNNFSSHQTSSYPLSSHKKRQPGGKPKYCIT